ncbi:hypothetical protein [Alteromonas australica]|uniref:hypothetical protein n=1 Tax=Alteromonas australica TaxID=589873 RepID=UPI003F673BB3
MVESIKTVSNGRKIEGIRKLSGGRLLTQTITLGNVTVVDSQEYSAKDKDGVMLVYAELILFQIFAGRTMGGG